MWLSKRWSLCTIAMTVVASLDKLTMDGPGPGLGGGSYVLP